MEGLFVWDIEFITNNNFFIQQITCPVNCLCPAGNAHNQASSSIDWKTALFPQRLGFIDEHDGNVIPDLINQFALFADKTIAGLIQMDIPFALGAGENVQKFLTDSHTTSLSSAGYLFQVSVFMLDPITPAFPRLQNQRPACSSKTPFTASNT